MEQERDSLGVVIQNEALFKAVYELILPEDTMCVGNIFKVPFTKIYQCFDFYKDDNILEAVALITGKSIEDFLKESANEAIKFMKWLEQEIDQCSKLLNSIPSVNDPDMAAAGADRMNDIGEFAIYRSITNDPRKWKSLGEVEFELMYVKLLGDGIQSVIQRDYNEIIKNKK
ncbi:hypothetical protein [Chryseobacterium sp. MYb328]|uniref:hypothetical protein n=1 Tax=Chryseobacterium sp. MYb328 TaxID=2745231 RepID=UPI0030AD82C3